MSPLKRQEEQGSSRKDRERKLGVGEIKQAACLQGAHSLVECSQNEEILMNFSSS